MNAVFKKSQLAGLAVERDPRWQAVMARDRASDGKFYYSVATTGVYCRPSCASRLARPENIAFHATGADAERAGFRPCKRCKPDQAAQQAQQAEKIAAICRAIEAAEEIPTLAELARKAGMSPFHFHRVFKAVTGVTPKAYATAHRAKRVRQELVRPDTSVTTAIYDAGFNSSGRFYEASDQVLGMTPKDYRAGGANAEIPDGQHIVSAEGEHKEHMGGPDADALDARQVLDHGGVVEPGQGLKHDAAFFRVLCQFADIEGFAGRKPHFAHSLRSEFHDSGGS